MEQNDRKYISVLLPLKLEWAPYYEVPAGETVSPGDWVRVIFANRPYTGIIMETDAALGTDISRIKTIISVERSLTPVSAAEMKLWKMVSDYYLCTPGEVFKAAYPLMKISQQETLARMQEREALKKARLREKLAVKLQKAEERLAGKEKKLENGRISLLKIKEKEIFLPEKEKKTAKKEKEIAGLEESVKKAALETESLRRELALATADAQGGCFAVEENPGPPETGIVLTEEQRRIFDGAIASIGKGKPVLVKGVTGSGKTEIYLELAARAMSEGKNVLYLIPEIAVSKQLTDRIRSIFGDRLLVYHSEETAAGRRNTAEKLRESSRLGRQYIVLGTRSAVFLPHDRLGLIIVDEEHDSSYKQDSPAPRYNGRDAAVMLSTIHGSGIVLGSATPSLESVFNAECGKYDMLTLSSKYYNATEADVEILDTSAERRKRGMDGSFSKKLISEINRTLENGGQVLIVRSRRAFSPVMQCPECGEIPKCPHCNVSLSFHKSPDRLTCHHCGYSEAFEPHCRKCGAVLQGLGSGTQKIEEETRARFPDARIARLDSDTARSKVAETVRKFNSGETDILIGTQIVSKGFDFPGLELSAIISADSLLGLQDFRADEKALQTLEQLRGRCGRRGRQGHFVIQTGMPEHPVYRQLAEGGSDILYPVLLSERKEFGYPPFTRLVNINIRDTDETRLERMAAGLAARLKGIFTESSMTDVSYEPVSAPFRPPVDKVADHYIRTVRVTLKKDRLLHRYKKSVAATVASFEKDNRYPNHITIDVDPE